MYTHQEVLLQRYPKLPTFMKQMEELDPHGVFLNDFGRRLRFGCSETSMDTNIKHCALMDICVCSTNEDCGDKSTHSLFCGNIKGYHVCESRLRRAEYLHRRGRLMRNNVLKLANVPTI